MTGKSSDRDYIQRCLNGEVGAFESLYRRYADRVYGIAYRLCLDRTQAEDFTQDAFIHIWQRLDHFDHRSEFSTWMYRVASNLILGKLRSRRTLLPVDKYQDSEGKNDSTEMSMDIERQLRRLPDRARIILVLHDLVGMTHDEIADELNIAPGTSKTQLFRARNLYRRSDNERSE